MKILELLDGPEKWTQGAFARDRRGEDVDSDRPEAVCWCLSGAITKCHLDSLRSAAEIDNKLRNTCEALYGTSNYVDWQDRPDTTFEQVRALLVLADV
mgnify:CR=1 FL=1